MLNFDELGINILKEKNNRKKEPLYCVLDNSDISLKYLKRGYESKYILNINHDKIYSDYLYKKYNKQNIEKNISFIYITEDIKKDELLNDIKIQSCVKTQII